jgi:hypothetical protein
MIILPSTRGFPKKSSFNINSMPKVLWLDANSITTSTFSTWPNLVGNGINASLTGASGNVVKNAGGFIRFGPNSPLSNPFYNIETTTLPWTNTGEWTLYYVIKRYAYSADAVYAIENLFDSNLLQFDQYSGLTINNGAASNYKFPSVFSVLCVKFSGSLNNTGFIKQNNVSYYGQNFLSSLAITKFRMSNVDCGLAEMIAFDKYTTNAEDAGIYGYLSSKWSSIMGT